jgi:hypothetical protein
MSLLLALLAGCGASTPPPTPPPTPFVDPGAPLPPDAVVQTMQAQAVIDHPEVAMYLHLEIAGHVPLTVHAAADLAEGVAGLTAAGQPVQGMDVPGKARLHLVRRESLGGPKVRIHLAIPEEGVSGHVDLTLADYVWSAVDARLTEH